MFAQKRLKPKYRHITYIHTYIFFSNRVSSCLMFQGYHLLMLLFGGLFKASVWILKTNETKWTSFYQSVSLFFLPFSCLLLVIFKRKAVRQTQLLSLFTFVSSVVFCVDLNVQFVPRTPWRAQTQSGLFCWTNLNWLPFSFYLYIAHAVSSLNTGLALYHPAHL